MLNNYLEYSFLNPTNYELRFNAQDYDIRSAFLTVLNDSTSNLTFYLQPNTTSEIQTLKLINTNNELVENGIILLQKQVSDQENLYYTIAEAKTDFNGLTNVYLIRNTNVYYRFAVLKDGQAMPIIPTLNLYTGQTSFIPNIVETVQLIINEETSVLGFSSAFNNIIYNINFSGVENRTVNYYYFDGENTISGAKLKVYGRFLTNTSINYSLVQEISSTGTYGALNYTLPNLSNSIYKIQAYITIDNNDFLIWEGYKELNTTDKVEKNLGMFFTIILLIFVALTTSKLGTLLSSILTFGSLFIMSIIGLVNIPATIITSLIAFSVIVFIKVRSTT